MPRGASPKREREYEELKDRFQKSGRYGKRASQVAARIVNKQRAQHGETTGAKQPAGAAKSSAPELPIRNYPRMTIPQVKTKLRELSRSDLRRIESYEKKHKNRKGVLNAIEGRRKAA